MLLTLIIGSVLLGPLYILLWLNRPAMDENVRNAEFILSWACPGDCGLLAISCGLCHPWS